MDATGGRSCGEPSCRWCQLVASARKGRLALARWCHFTAQQCAAYIFVRRRYASLLGACAPTDWAESIYSRAFRVAEFDEELGPSFELRFTESVPEPALGLELRFVCSTPSRSDGR
jgi:hypothetical protein